SRGDLPDAVEGGNVQRPLRSRRSFAVPELTRLVVAPCKDGPVGLQSESEGTARRDRDDPASGTEALHLHGNRGVLGGLPVAELAGLVVPPRENRTIRLQRHRECVARGDPDDAAAGTEALDLSRGRRVRVAPDAQLPRLVVPPSEHRSIRLQREGECVASGDRGDAAARTETF